MGVKLREPLVRPVWPPKGYAKRVEVTEDDDWWILSAVHGRTDPWDLIVFNFGTRNPDEVNWCLHHILGCRRKSKDGKNYDFGAPCTIRQYIYIPPAGWKPPTTADDDAWERVRSTINSATVKTLNLSLFAYKLSISGHDFGKIGYLLNTKRITAKLDPTHLHAAEYLPGSDQIIIKLLPSDPIDRSHIVHEAVHASFDYRHSFGVRSYQLDEECFAYVVQMLYLQKFYGGTWPSGWSHEFEAKATWQAAWKVANAVRGPDPVHPDLTDALMTAYKASNAGNGVGLLDRPGHNGIR
ncbi:hypothetical protein Pan97_31700 [Bremerella volcania]|uniref:Uncharacterized protein n=1 Tax=Bremerella volcania TaxID=2527984 RepID=A0A518CA87_9BACT|nr:hypothetical protein [Bremerella volcania]QDU76125.1 hypothetical protein Pan97_31700 [Bremerella volcania]